MDSDLAEAVLGTPRESTLRGALRTAASSIRKVVSPAKNSPPKEQRPKKPRSIQQLFSGALRLQKSREEGNAENLPDQVPGAF